MYYCIFTLFSKQCELYALIYNSRKTVGRYRPRFCVLGRNERSNLSKSEILCNSFLTANILRRSVIILPYFQSFRMSASRRTKTNLDKYGVSAVVTSVCVVFCHLKTYWTSPRNGVCGCVML